MFVYYTKMDMVCWKSCKYNDITKSHGATLRGVETYKVAYLHEGWIWKDQNLNKLSLYDISVIIMQYSIKVNKNHLYENYN